MIASQSMRTNRKMLWQSNGIAGIKSDEDLRAIFILREQKPKKNKIKLKRFTSLPILDSIGLIPA